MKMKLTVFFSMSVLRGPVVALSMPNEFLLRLCLRFIITCLFFKYSLGAIYYGVPGRISCYSAWDKWTAYSKRRFKFRPAKGLFTSCEVYAGGIYGIMTGLCAS